MAAGFEKRGWCRGTSLMIKNPSIGTCSRLMPRALFAGSSAKGWNLLEMV